MDKFGYEAEKKDVTVKTASEEGRCPICGEKATGQPPICPEHGSAPFEKREDGDGRH